MQHLFVEKKPELGLYQCKFYKNGHWQAVAVDDRLLVGHRYILLYSFVSAYVKIYVLAESYFLPRVETQLNFGFLL